MRTLRVNLGDRAYYVLVGSDLLRNAGSWIKKTGIPQREALVVSQSAVAGHYQNLLSEALSREGFSHSFFLTPAAKSSEAAKSQVVFSKLIKRLSLSEGENRSVFMIALGGGVIGDLTGFAASVYRRGIPYVQIPTTLTAQVDSAIGGKTGIDLPQGKNLLGTVYQPSLVLSDRRLLETLPERHWIDGFAEVIKYGVIKDPVLFATLDHYGKDALIKNPRVMEKVISRSVRIKTKIVEKDEWDRKGIRIALNFGHTAGHAIEAASRFSSKYTHGEAVAIGMLVACDIAQRLSVLKDERLTERLEKTLIKFGLPLFHKGVSIEALLKSMGYDKKADAGSNRFVLPVRMGQTAIHRNVPTSVIEEALKKRKQ